MTQLEIATEGHHKIAEFLELCLPLHFASYRGDFDEVKQLTEKQYHDPLQKLFIDDNRTALHCAADAGHLNVLKYFVERKFCNPVCADKNGATPLHLAAGKGHLDIVKYLTQDKECYPVIKDVDGNTPLHYAARDCKGIRVLKFFVSDLKCNPNIQNNMSETPICLSLIHI